MASSPPPIPKRFTSLRLDSNSTRTQIQQPNTTSPAVPPRRKSSTAASLPPPPTFPSLSSNSKHTSLPRKRKAVTFNENNSYYESPWEYETVLLLNNCDMPGIEGCMDELSLHPHPQSLRVQSTSAAKGEEAFVSERESMAVDPGGRESVPWKTNLYRTPTSGNRLQGSLTGSLNDRGEDRSERRGKRKVRVIRLINKGMKMLKQAVG